MRHFEFKEGEMWAENVSLREIAQTVGTPCYVYAHTTLSRHYHVFADNFKDLPHLVAFAVKANSNLAVLSTLAGLGAGADVVSGGELERALKAGISGDKILFSGVGKSMEEMQAALRANIKLFNVESQAELHQLNQVAQKMGVIAPIAFRINPDIDAGTHAKISTGKRDNKFGISWASAQAAYRDAARLPAIKVTGIDVHIGSQINKLAPFEKAIGKVGTLIADLRTQGHDIRSFDLGGGLGIPYNDGEDVPPLPAEYGAMVKKLTADMDVELIFEPGRMIAGNAGILLSRVMYTKETDSRLFLIIDAAMNDLIRPALYDAYHQIEPVMYPTSESTQQYDVVGPICESSDIFAKARVLPPMQAGDLLVIHSAGAYGAVQAHQYNTRPLVPEVMVKGNQFSVIRRRPSFEDMFAMEYIPEWV